MQVTHSKSSWLRQTNQKGIVNVDVDSMDPEYIKTMPDTLGFVPHDQTSNQLWADVEFQKDYNQELLRQTAAELKDKGWLHIYTRVVRMHHCAYRSSLLKFADNRGSCTSPSCFAKRT